MDRLLEKWRQMESVFWQFYFNGSCLDTRETIIACIYNRCSFDFRAAHYVSVDSTDDNDDFHDINQATAFQLS